MQNETGSRRNVIVFNTKPTSDSPNDGDDGVTSDVSIPSTVASPRSDARGSNDFIAAIVLAIVAVGVASGVVVLSFALVTYRRRKRVDTSRAIGMPCNLHT